MPGFCSCGFIPRPSAGVKASRSNGLAPEKSMTAMKNTVTDERDAGDVRHAAARSAAGVIACASVANSDSTTAQNSSEPFWPAQNAEKR